MCIYETVLMHYLKQCSTPCAPLQGHYRIHLAPTLQNPRTGGKDFFCDEMCFDIFRLKHNISKYHILPDCADNTDSVAINAITIAQNVMVKQSSKLANHMKEDKKSVFLLIDYNPVELFNILKKCQNK